MSRRIIPFDTSEYCDECGVRGAFDYMGDYLCEKCSRMFIDSEEDEYEDYPESKQDCPCDECKCGKEQEPYHSWLI